MSTQKIKKKSINFTKSESMKGVNFLLNEQNEKIAVQIDMKTIKNYQEDIEDLLDGIVAEARKDEQKIPLSKGLKNLKKAGKF